MRQYFLNLPFYAHSNFEPAKSSSALTQTHTHTVLLRRVCVKVKLQ